MPCSSSDTGPSSNWESCCNALSGFLAASPAASSRTEAVLNNGSRRRRRDARLNSHGGGNRSHVLAQTFAPAAVSHAGASRSIPVTVDAPPSSRERTGGGPQGAARLSHRDATGVTISAGGQGQTAADGGVQVRDQPAENITLWSHPPSDSLRTVTFAHPGLPQMNDEGVGTAHVAKGEQSAYWIASAASRAVGRPATAPCVAATGASDAAPYGSDTTASVFPSASAPPAAVFVRGVPAALVGVVLAGAEGIVGAGLAAADFAPWKRWLATTQNKGCVWSSAKADTNALLSETNAADINRAGTPCVRLVMTGVPQSAKRTVMRRAPQQTFGHMWSSPSAVDRTQPLQHQAQSSLRDASAAATTAPAIPVLREGACNVAILLDNKKKCEGLAARSAGIYTGEDNATDAASTCGVGCNRQPSDAGAEEGFCRAVSTGFPRNVPLLSLERTSGEEEERSEQCVITQAVYYSPRECLLQEREALKLLALPSAEVQRNRTFLKQHDVCGFSAQCSKQCGMQPRPLEAAQQRRSEGHVGHLAPTAHPRGTAEEEEAASNKLYSKDTLYFLGCARGSPQSFGSGEGVIEQEKISTGQQTSTSRSKSTPGASLRAASCRKTDYFQCPSQSFTGEMFPHTVSETARAHVDSPQFTRQATHATDSGLAGVQVDVSVLKTESIDTMHTAVTTHEPLAKHVPRGERALGEVATSASKAVEEKKRVATTEACAALRNPAVESSRNGRTHLSGVSSSFKGGKPVGLPSRQRAVLAGGEDTDDWKNSWLGRERLHAPTRRVRCQRPASWKRIRQTVGGQRGCDFFSLGGLPAVVEADAQLQQESMGQRQRGSGQQGVEQTRLTVESRKRVIRSFSDNEEAEETVCRSTGVSVGVLGQTGSQGKSDTLMRGKLFKEVNHDTPVVPSCDSRSGASAVAVESGDFLRKNEVETGDNASPLQVLCTNCGQARVNEVLLNLTERTPSVLHCDGLHPVASAGALQAARQRKNTSVSSVHPEAQAFCVGCHVDPSSLLGNIKGDYHSNSRNREGETIGMECAAAGYLRRKSPTLDAKEKIASTVLTRSSPSSFDACRSLQRVRRSSVSRSVAGIRTASGGEGMKAGSALPKEHVWERGGEGEEETRRRSIGPGDSHKFEDDTSGEEGSTPSNDVKVSLSQQLSSSQGLPRHLRAKAQQLRRPAPSAAACSDVTSTPACIPPAWSAELVSSSEEVDEDEASRFFKRRRCSLLLWGGVSGDRGYAAAHHVVALGAPVRRTRGLTDTMGHSVEVGSFPFGRTSEMFQGKHVVEYSQEVLPTSSTGGKQQPMEQAPPNGLPVLEEIWQEGAAAAHADGLPHPAHFNTATSSAGAASVMPLPLQRKRKRGVGASATRLLFLQRAGAGGFSEDAALVNTLSRALTPEETQQLRRHEQEQRLQELSRQQEEARRKEEAAAKRLKEEQKSAAVAIATVNSVLPSAPYIFASTGSTAPLVVPGNTNVTLPAGGVQQAYHTASAAEDSSTVKLSTGGGFSALSSGGDTVESTKSAPLLMSSSVSPEGHAISQCMEQHQQVREVSLAGRPKLRIIRSPPPAGDFGANAAPASPEVPAYSLFSASSGVPTARNASMLAISNEKSVSTTAPVYQREELPPAFGGGRRGFISDQSEKSFFLTRQLQASDGVLPAEFGGTPALTSASGAEITAPSAFGSSSTFATTSTGGNSVSANPFAFQRGGRGLRNRGSAEHRYQLLRLQLERNLFRNVLYAAGGDDRRHLVTSFSKGQSPTSSADGSAVMAVVWSTSV